MTVEKTFLEGVLIINNFNSYDNRGFFVKTYNKSMFKELDIDFEVKETYMSCSKKDVIRGMHFQLPPFDHEKIVTVLKGKIIDVVIDLRKESSTYKKYMSIELSDKNKKSIYIPKGLAHGFKSMIEDTITLYHVASEHNPQSDTGIQYNSFNFDWDLDTPIISIRDMGFVSLDSFCESNYF